MACNEDSTENLVSDPELTISYQTLRQLFPQLSEEEWFGLKATALDAALEKLLVSMSNIKRRGPSEPATNGDLLTVLEHVANVFKWQRAVLLDRGTLKSSAVPMKWLGLSLEKKNEGLVVVGVLPDSPAKVAGLVPGDMLMKIGEHRVSELNDIGSALKKHVHGTVISMALVRHGKNLTVDIVPKLFIALQRGSDLVSDMKCDDNCECKTPELKATCWTILYSRGRGPNGGILLRRTCTTINDDGWPVKHNSCNLDGEWI